MGEINTPVGKYMGKEKYFAGRKFDMGKIIHQKGNYRERRRYLIERNIQDWTIFYKKNTVLSSRKYFWGRKTLGVERGGNTGDEKYSDG